MDPYICCLLGICCPPFSAEQRASLAKMLMARDVCKEYSEAERVAEFHVKLVEQVVVALKGDKA